MFDRQHSVGSGENPTQRQHAGTKPTMNLLPNESLLNNENEHQREVSAILRIHVNTQFSSKCFFKILHFYRNFFVDLCT